MRNHTIGFTAAIITAALLALGLAACGQVGKEAAGTVTVTVAQTVTVGAADTGQAEVTEQAKTEEAATDSVTTTEGASSEPTLTIVKSGWGQDEGSTNYSIEVKNESATDDALEIIATVNLVGGDTVLATDTQYLNVIPAGATVFISGQPSVEGQANITGIDAIVEFDHAEAATYPLPKVSKVRVTHEYGSVVIRGEVENNLDGRLSDFAQINAAAFDSGGNILGGCFTFLSSSLPPGRKAAFECYLYSNQGKKIETARATMDNGLASDQ